MAQKLPYHVRLVRNPYQAMISNRELKRILFGIAEERAEDILERWSTGEYKPNTPTPPSFGVVVMDPTAPLQVPSIDAVLAIITIGSNGLEYVPNAAAKAFAPREKGADTGELLYAHRHRLSEGDFRWGFGIVIDGTSLGGSGLSETQDRVQAGHIGLDFNHMVMEAIKKWEEEHPDQPRWFSNDNQPNARFTHVLGLRELV